MSKIVDIKEFLKKKEKKKILMDIIFIFSILYIIYAIYLTTKMSKDTVAIEKGTLTQEESATGYIIRDEIVVKGKSYKNGIDQILQEGEKSAKKETIFRYYGKSEDELQEEITELNLKINKALEKEKKILSNDVKNLENQIDTKIQTLKLQTDLQQISEQKKQLSDIMTKKTTIAGENSKSGKYIKSLINKKEEYERRLVEGSEYMSAPSSGVVSYRVDGLENVLTTKGIKNLTEEILEKLEIKTGKIVATSNEQAKIIDNFGCYIATILNSNEAIEAKVGNKVKITLSSGNEVMADVYYLKNQENGKMLIVFKLNTLTEELISYRKISFNITWWNYSGLKVPNDAILENNDKQKYVVKKTTSGTTNINIKVLKTNKNYSIINTYSAEDLKALGRDISEMETLEVYDKILLYPE